MNTVVFDNWFLQPIHCPFCGHALPPNEEVACKHLLYIIANDNFVFRSERFDAILGADQDDFGPEFSRADSARYGGPLRAARDVIEQLPNGIEFDLPTPTDGALIGFAAWDAELCAFGKDHQSPYD